MLRWYQFVSIGNPNNILDVSLFGQKPIFFACRHPYKAKFFIYPVNYVPIYSISGNRQARLRTKESRTCKHVDLFVPHNITVSRFHKRTTLLLRERFNLVNQTNNLDLIAVLLSAINTVLLSDHIFIIPRDQSDFIIFTTQFIIALQSAVFYLDPFTLLWMEYVFGIFIQFTTVLYCLWIHFKAYMSIIFKWHCQTFLSYL